MKKFFIAFLLLLVIAGAVVYYYRYEIFQYSAESIIMQNLPPYVTVKRIIFDLKDNTLKVEGLKIKNPRGYSNKFLARIDTITCRYKKKGRKILDGIKVTEIIAAGPVISIERLNSGRLNVNEMDGVMGVSKKEEGRRKKKEEDSIKTRAVDEAGGEKTVIGEKRGRQILNKIRSMFSGVVDFLKTRVKRVYAEKKISDIITLPGMVSVKNGKVIFSDGLVSRSPYVLIFGNIEGDIFMTLNDDYNKVLRVESQGSGIINGDVSQRLRWVLSLDPTAKDLTMSNRYEVQNIDITAFQPYYDEFSPITIYSGICSGTLVFDFDHGNIGSMNTLVIRGLRFEEKRTRDGAGAWQGTNISDVIRYLRSGYDEITFDFRIKGNMKNPRFYPGPRVKNAIQGLVVEKVVDALSKPQTEGGGGGGVSDAERVADILKDLF